MSEDRVKYGTNDDYREIGELLGEVQEKLLRLDDIIRSSRDKSLSASLLVNTHILISSTDKLSRDFKLFLKGKKDEKK